MRNKLSDARRYVKGTRDGSRARVSLDASGTVPGYALARVALLRPCVSEIHDGGRCIALAIGSDSLASALARQTIDAAVPPLKLPLELCGRVYWLRVALQALLVVDDLSARSRRKAQLLDAHIARLFPNPREHPRVILGTLSGGMFALRRGAGEPRGCAGISGLTVVFDYCRVCDAWIAGLMEFPPLCHVCGSPMATRIPNS